MNLGIYSNNYHVPAFRNNSGHTRKVIAALLTPVALMAAEINGMSSDEITGRSLVQKSHTDVLKDKINNNPVLSENKSIQQYFNTIVMEGMDVPETHYGEMSLEGYVSEKAAARNKVLNYYANNSKIQNNDLIKDKIGKLVSLIKKEEQANVVIEALRTNNSDKEYYDRLGDMLYYDIRPNIIEKVMSNQTLYSNIKAETLYTVHGYEQRIVQKVKEMLDGYLDTRETSSNDRNLDTILLKSFSQYKADPLTYLVKMQADYELDNEIDNALFEIESRNKNNKKVLQKSINDLRELRTEIKEHVEQFDDNLKTGILKSSLDLLNSRIEEYKKLLNKADESSVNDDLSEYEKIKAML